MASARPLFYLCSSAYAGNVNYLESACFGHNTHTPTNTHLYAYTYTLVQRSVMYRQSTNEDDDNESKSERVRVNWEWKESVYMRKWESKKEREKESHLWSERDYRTYVQKDVTNVWAGSKERRENIKTQSTQTERRRETRQTFTHTSFLCWQLLFQIVFSLSFLPSFLLNNATYNILSFFILLSISLSLTHSHFLSYLLIYYISESMKIHYRKSELIFMYDL